MKLISPDDPVLWTPAVPVTDFDAVLPLADKLAQTMRAHRGVGLAAPQVGISQRFFVMMHDHAVFAVVNPVILSHGRDEETEFEGCLSFGEPTCPVARWRVITVEYQTERGVTVRRTVKGLEARIFQHEACHLDGVCIFPRPNVRPSTCDACPVANGLQDASFAPGHEACHGDALEGTARPAVCRGLALARGWIRA